MGKNTQKTFKVTFKLIKHKSLMEFDYYLKVDNEKDLPMYIDKYCKSFQEKYGTPIKCIKQEEVADYPKELRPKKEDTDG